MSGPKVVRIVTREEIIAICEGLLARLEAVQTAWAAVAGKAGILTDADVSSMTARREELRRLLSDDRFTEVQKAVTVEIASLATERSERLTRAAEALARKRITKRQAAAMSASVLAALDRSTVAVTPELRHALEEAASERADGTAAIRQAFDLLATKDTPAITDEQRRLAAALKDGDDRVTVGDWIAGQPVSSDDDRLARLDRKLADLAVLLGESATAGFEERLGRVSSERQSARQDLLYDSLEVDLARAVAKARELDMQCSSARMLAAELAQAGTAEAVAAACAIDAAIDAKAGDLKRLEDEGRAVLAIVRAASAAESRRRAVLEGLAQIGYDINEGMQTAWARDGRVVVKRASQPGYGVELAGDPDSPRLQARTVALRSASAPADTIRDRDAETMWCGDLGKLRERVAATGGEIIIERARAVGEVPLRTIEEATDQAQAGERTIQNPALQKRRVE